MRMQTLFTRRKALVAALSLLCLLIAGIYTWQSLAAWKGYESRLTKEQAAYTQLKEDALNGTSVEKRVAALRALDEKLADRGELCQIHPLFAWQSVIIPVLKDGVKRCQDKVWQLDAIAGPLHELRQYLDTAEAVQAALRDLTPSEGLNERNWTEKGLQAAEKSKATLGRIKASGDAATLKADALTLSDSLIKAWQALITANGAKDKVAFVTATAQVGKAYAGFAGLADTADSAISTKVDRLTQLAAQL